MKKFFSLLVFSCRAITHLGISNPEISVVKITALYGSTVIAVLAAFIAVLTGNSAAADGCYIESGQNTCSTTPISCEGSDASNEVKYGRVIAALCKEGNLLYAERLQLITGYNFLTDALNKKTLEADTLRTQTATLTTEYTKIKDDPLLIGKSWKSYINKVLAACGKACKSIKRPGSSRAAKPATKKLLTTKQ